MKAVDNILYDVDGRRKLGLADESGSVGIFFVSAVVGSRANFT